MQNYEIVAGIDEAGRGPLAGPVVAAAVVLHSDRPIAGLTDSKKISPQKRLRLFAEIKSKAQAWGVGEASAAEIDEMNIHNATLKAMLRAYLDMQLEASHVLVDGLYCPDLSAKCTAIVKGDQTVPAISAASIIAKVTRDIQMLEYHDQMPEYGFDRHKGYPTSQHIQALKEYGPCNLHRRSYKPVRDAINIHKSQLA